jgi:hypothetical protein
MGLLPGRQTFVIDSGADGEGRGRERKGARTGRAAEGRCLLV